MKSVKAVLGIMLATSLCHAQKDAEIQTGDKARDKVDVLVGVGYAISPGYRDFFDEFYESMGYDDTAGIGGWLGLYLGIEYKVWPQVSLIGGCDLMFNFVDVTGRDLDESYVNTIINPSLYAQFYFTEARSFYVNGGLSLPIPNTGSDYIEFENDGIGLGANIGYAVGEGLARFEVGYTLLPVKVKGDFSEEKFHNFGGFQIRILFGF